MASNTEKVEAIISSVYNKTISGQIEWKPAFGERTYQVRVGNFVILLDGGPTSLYGLCLTIRKIDGSVVANIPERNNALIELNNVYRVSSVHWQFIRDIFAFIDNREGDLDELFDLLK